MGDPLVVKVVIHQIVSGGSIGGVMPMMAAIC